MLGVVLASIEQAKAFSGVGVKVEHTNFLTGARSFPAFPDLVRNRDLAGRENKDAPGVWYLGRAVPICALLPNSASNRIDDVANFMPAGNTDFIERQKSIRKLSRGRLNAVAGTAPCSDEPALVTAPPNRCRSG